MTAPGMYHKINIPLIIPVHLNKMVAASQSANAGQSPYRINGLITDKLPQINLFVLSIQLRLAVGFALLVFLVSPTGSFLGNVITTMMSSLEDVLRVMAAG